MSIAVEIRPTVTARGALCLRHDTLGTRTVLVSAAGELDAGNARELVDFVDAAARAVGPRSVGRSPATEPVTIVVDLGSLAFFGTEGLWAVNRAKATCAKHRLRSAVVAGPEVARLLRVCDPHGALGVVASVADAVSATPI